MWKPKTAKVGRNLYTIVQADEGWWCLRKKHPVSQVRLWKYLIKRFIRWNMEIVCTG